MRKPMKSKNIHSHAFNILLSTFLIWPYRYLIASVHGRSVTLCGKLSVTWRINQVAEAVVSGI